MNIENICLPLYRNNKTNKKGETHRNNCTILC
nr:MAG TPA: hypothetical protein [Caudoviricetes sp.]